MKFPNTWKRSVNIGGVLRSDMPLKEKGREVARRLAKDPAFEDESELLANLVEAAESGDVEEFDDHLAVVYDIADAERIWVSGR